MSDRAPVANAAQTVAAHPPLSVAIMTIGVIAVAMVGSTISSQLVDLDIADIGGGFSVSADDARGEPLAVSLEIGWTTTRDPTYC